MNNRPQLPFVSPDEEITVSEEQHTFEAYKTDTGTEQQLEYTLDKAPATGIDSVRGVSDGTTRVFINGIDYELSGDNERIVWKSTASNRPDIDSFFYVTYTTDSILSRYLDSSEKELDEAERRLRETIGSKFIDTATGSELDEIGKLFGPVIGKRNDRNDTQYRIYLKSVVQSFVSRGTVNGIKLAISAATDVPIEDITIDENFTDVEYEIIVEPNTPVTVGQLETVAEIADPSGVELITTKFALSDRISADDSFSINPNTFVIDADEFESNDDSFINPNTFVTDSDILSVDDNPFVNPNTVANFDSADSNDSVTVEETLVGWGTNWQTLNWA